MVLGTAVVVVIVAIVLLIGAVAGAFSSETNGNNTGAVGEQGTGNSSLSDTALISNSALSGSASAMNQQNSFQQAPLYQALMPRTFWQETAEPESVLVQDACARKAQMQRQHIIQEAADQAVTAETLLQVDAAPEEPQAFSLVQLAGIEPEVISSSIGIEPEAASSSAGAEPEAVSSSVGAESGGSAPVDPSLGFQPPFVAPTLSAQDELQLQEAISAITSQGYDCGVVAFNVNTGCGIAYNADTRIYGASSFKGPYAAFMCEAIGDAEGLSSSTRSLIDDTVQYSDNDSFKTLRDTYDSHGFVDWLESCGVNSDIMDDTHFPRYSAREAALLWLHTYSYLQSDSEYVSYLAQLFQNTNTSFIRDGVDAAMADDAPVVMNKAGWNASDARFSGTCDAGIVEYLGQTYIMAIMTNAPDSDDSRTAVSNVAQVLFSIETVNRF